MAFNMKFTVKLRLLFLFLTLILHSCIVNRIKSVYKEPVWSAGSLHSCPVLQYDLSRLYRPAHEYLVSKQIRVEGRPHITKFISDNTVSVIWNQELFPNSGIASELNEKIRETYEYMPHGKLKHRYWFFAYAPNIDRNCTVVLKYLWRWSDSYGRHKYRGGCTIPLFRVYDYDMKSLSPPDTIALLGNNYSLQIGETGFCGAVFFASHRMPLTNLFLKFPQVQLKARPIEWYHWQSASFLIGHYL